MTLVGGFHIPHIRHVCWDKVSARAALSLTGLTQGASFGANKRLGRYEMPGLLQGIVLFLVGCVVVYGLIASLKPKAAEEGHGHGGHGHGHH